MRGDVVDDVVGNEASDDAFLVFGFETNELQRPLHSGRVNDGLDGAPHGQHGSRQHVIRARA